MRKFLGTFVLSTALLVSGFQPAFGTEDGVVPEADQIRSILRTQLPRALWVEPEDDLLRFGIAFNGGQQALGNQISYIRTEFFENERPVTSRVCDGYLDNTCLTDIRYPYSSTWASVILPVCSEDDRSACLETISITKNGVATQGTFLEYVDNTISDSRKQAIEDLEVECCSKESGPPPSVEFPTSTEWDADLSRGLPAAKSPSKWKVNNVDNKGSADTYMARATVQLFIDRTGQVTFQDLSAEVIPYVETNNVSGGTFYPPSYFNRVNNVYGDGTFPGSPRFPIASFDNPGDTNPITCAWEEESPSLCGIAVQFADGTRTSMTIRIPAQLGGWFHGRVAKPDLDLSAYNAELNRLVISAEDVDVPTAGASFPILDPAYATYKDHFFANNPEWIQQIIDREPNDRGLGSWGQWNPSESVDPFTVMEPLMGDTANGSVNMWQFGTLPQYETSNACFENRNRVQGMISTNAMVYQAGLPSFGAQGFTYQVGGLHKDYLSQDTKGSYSLIMRTEEARCLYGLGDSDFTSNVEVTDSTGTSKPSQTSVTNDGTWLRIWADDFTFSSPSISVNLAKKAELPAISVPQLTQTITIPAVIKGKARTKKVILTDLGITLTKGQKASIKIKKASKRVCSVSGSKVKAKKKGTCSYTVTVKNKKGKKILTKSGSFTVL